MNMATDDLVARLRYGQGQDWDIPYATREEAAATIESLRAELAARDAEIAAWLRGAYAAGASLDPQLATAIASGQYRKDRP
jgi:hypothetical protein